MAHYCLKKVKNVAQKGKVEYRGRKVQRDISNLGYELKDVITCLIALTESDFHKTLRYDDNDDIDDIDDVYHIEHFNPITNSTDALYIKFCLINGSLTIDLASFHL